MRQSVPSASELGGPSGRVTRGSRARGHGDAPPSRRPSGGWRAAGRGLIGRVFGGTPSAGYGLADELASDYADQNPSLAGMSGVEDLFVEKGAIDA